jgi:hypothetical protein
LFENVLCRFYFQNSLFERSIAMKQKMYSAGHFVWIPKHLRLVGKNGLSIPKNTYKVDNRNPLLWVKSEGNDLFLINSSGFVLQSVKAQTNGFAENLTIKADGFYYYENIQNGEAVKIDEYDPFYDNDFTLQTQIEITADRLGGTICPKLPPSKKMIEEHVIMWDNELKELWKEMTSE